ncbi:UNVERIFIED_CONTAM: hypothetical protein FKN15_038543 [Acipenser sinensis]
MSLKSYAVNHTSLLFDGSGIRVDELYRENHSSEKLFGFVTGINTNTVVTFMHVQ